MDLPCKRSDLLFIRWCDAVCDSECAQIEEARKAQLAVNVNVGWRGYECCSLVTEKYICHNIDRIIDLLRSGRLVDISTFSYVN